MAIQIFRFKKDGSFVPRAHGSRSWSTTVELHPIKTVVAVVLGLFPRHTSMGCRKIPRWGWLTVKIPIDLPGLQSLILSTTSPAASRMILSLVPSESSLDCLLVRIFPERDDGAFCPYVSVADAALCITQHNGNISAVFRDFYRKKNKVPTLAYDHQRLAAFWPNKSCFRNRRGVNKTKSFVLAVAGGWMW